MIAAKGRIETFLLLVCLLFSGATETRAQVTSDEQRFALSVLDRDLRSPFAKAGLELMVWAAFEARVKLSPQGYEQSAEFQRGFRNAFSVFRKRLCVGDLESIGGQIDK